MDEYIIHFNKQGKNENMKNIENAIFALNEYGDEIPEEKIIEVLEAIRYSMNLNEQFVIPIELPDDVIETIKGTGLEVEKDFETPDDIRFKIRSLELDDGTPAFVAFTNQEEAMKRNETSTITEDVETYLHRVLMNPDLAGIIINPWGDSFYLPKSNIRAIFNVNIPTGMENIIHIGTLDITESEATCIVNAANKSLLGGGGVDGAIHRAAGAELLKECRTLNGCETGEAKITKGYNLKAKYVIHTVGPRYSGKKEDAILLRNCYWNSLELARLNDIHSIAFPAISTGVYGYPLEEATEIALHTVSDWVKVNHSYGMAVQFACFDDKTTEIYNKIWNEKEEIWNERPIIRENNGKLEEAIQFAMDAHKGMYRKGTDRPYILHPIETLQILSSMDADTNLMVAGVLHDTIEDTDVTLLDIYDKFGVDVAALVNGNTEDKRRVWYTRKLTTINQLPTENIRQKMLCIADKVSNLRSMYADYKAMGDDLWQRFNAPKEFQAWYFSKINDGMGELEGFPETSGVYWEMTALYKDLFVAYYLDDAKGLLYQISDDGTNVVLKKGRPQWKPLEGNISKKAQRIERKYAECLEDEWAKPFWELHDKDMEDGVYELYSGEGRSLYADMNEQSFTLHGEDWGEDCKVMNGKTEYEFHYTLDNYGTHRLLTQLRLEHGLRNKLETILKKEFGCDDGPMKFQDYCNSHDIEFQCIRL